MAESKPIVAAPDASSGAFSYANARSIDPQRASQVALTLTDAQGYALLIGYTPATREVFIDRTRAGPHFHDAFPDRNIATLPPGEGPVTLRLVVDRSIVELYAADGTRTITDRFFRGSGVLTWSANAIGGEAVIRTLDAWPIVAPPIAATP